jgi:hypothetical protein
MKELTLERNPMDVRNVGKFLLKPVTFEFMKELTVERNPMHVSSVGKPTVIPITFHSRKNSQWRETL